MDQPIGPFSSVFVEKVRGPFMRPIVWIPMPCGANVVLLENEFDTLLESGSFENITGEMEASDGETTAATAVGTDADGILSSEFE